MICQQQCAKKEEYALSTQSTGVLRVPNLSHGEINVQVALRNYNSNSSKAVVTVNRFLSTGRKSQVICKDVVVPAFGASTINLANLQGSLIEVIVKGSTRVKPSVIITQQAKTDEIKVLLLIGPRLFVSL